MMKDIAIYGAGGFGREVLTLIHDINKSEIKWNIIGFFDDGKEKGEIVNGFPILGGITALNEWATPLSIAVSIGAPSVKKTIIKRINNPIIDYPTLIHSSVIIGDERYVQIGKGCIICANNVITTNVKIGDFVIFNLCCTVGHDAVIGDYSAVMPVGIISGEVNIGEEVYIGTGATIINQINIGEKATIGAGAVVIHDVPDGATVVGVPAKEVKRQK